MQDVLLVTHTSNKIALIIQTTNKRRVIPLPPSKQMKRLAREPAHASLVMLQTLDRSGGQQYSSGIKIFSIQLCCIARIYANHVTPLAQHN